MQRERENHILGGVKCCILRSMKLVSGLLKCQGCRETLIQALGMCIICKERENHILSGVKCCVLRSVKLVSGLLKCQGCRDTLIQALGMCIICKERENHILGGVKCCVLRSMKLVSGLLKCQGCRDTLIQDEEKKLPAAWARHTFGVCTDDEFSVFVRLPDCQKRNANSAVCSAVPSLF